MKLVLFLTLLTKITWAQTLNLPPRNVGSQTGSQVVNSISNLTLHDREVYILNEIMTGNVPMFYRNMIPIVDSVLISGLYKKITYYAIPDYLAVGSATDYFLCPMTPILGQVIADSLNCILPTSKMVDQIWSHATVKMQPQTIPPSAQMTTVPVFDNHNDLVLTSRQSFMPNYPLGELVSGDKKDVIISNLIYTTAAPARVVIYGWHYPAGGNIQPRYAGHIDTYADYSHGIRLVQNQVTVDGNLMLASDVLTSNTLYTLLSDEGIIMQPYYPDTATSPPIVTSPNVPKSFCLTQINSSSSQITVSPDSNVDQYELFQSLDGITYSGPTFFSSSSFSISNVTPNVINYFKIKASNTVGMSSFSEVLAITPSDNSSSVIIINAFDRNTTGNSKNFIIQHGEAIFDYSLNFSSATNEAYVNGLVDLIDFPIVDYILGEESSLDETFSTSEQTIIKNYLNQGGYLFVSGAEVGWDLDHLGNTSDIDFYENYLKANYVFDAPNDEIGVHYQFEGMSSSPFLNFGITNFDNGTNGTYDVKYPDEVNGINGGENCLWYSNLVNSHAGVNYHGLFPNAIADSGKLVYHAIPFETIYPETKRTELMSAVLDYFLLAPVDSSSGIKATLNKVNYYPNPFLNFIQLTSNEQFTHYELYNINGKMIIQGKISPTKLINFEENIPIGMYLLKIKNKNKEQLLKLIKE